MNRAAPGSILIVDDTPSNLHLMAAVLREGGYAVRAVPTGRLALDAVSKRPPDLILLDIKMPEMDGFEVCRRLKADPISRDIPVIFLSALQDSQDKLQGFAVGAVDYITKPFVAEEVLVRVKTHLTLRELQIRLERKVSERTRALRTLSAGNQAVVHSQTVEELFEQMCHAIIEQGGYHAVWVNLAGRNTYSYGPETVARHACERIASSIATPDAPCLLGNYHMQTNPDWLACGATAALALPLCIKCFKEQPCGSLVVFSAEHRAFSSAEDVAVLAEMAGDLIYGAETLQAREEHLKNRLILEHSLEQTIAAIAATIEVRDPYTSGHQRRTTQIAMAIAQQLGLGEEQLKGLQVAGTIHDIGKIAVPIEILARPGKLTQAEFNVIKHHPVTGYEIISGIDFPWPVAQIILQHHERMDGSGYPHGLGGDEILLESRILAVADVVEAISSHRPYRPSLGMDSAVDELKQGQGSRYDAKVVDSFLQLLESGELASLESIP